LVPEEKVLGAILVFLIALVLGSFATALSWRAARDISWVSGRSRCPSCGTKLGIADLVPLFSWLILRGRCRHCGKSIGARYPLTELAVVAGCLGVFAAWGFTVPAFIIMAAVPFLVALIVVDMEQMILPDGLQAVLAGLGVLFVAASFLRNPYPDTTELLTGHMAGLIIFPATVWIAGRLVSTLKKKDALGFGDVKFFAVAGLWLGVLWLPCFMVISGLFGVAGGLFWQLRREDRRFPFGPALILAFYACLLLAGQGISPIFGL
jgi:leader peptidase (prepilin peptidase) / N-methyltransferase